LQYAFREKLNSTPKQWIRQQRLKAARAQLESPKGPSVQVVARSCGDLSLSHFCTDFKREFGLPASELRRKRI
ncbi:MAG: helix-turn-helix domain-containing protein, partial [Cyanobium sp.]